jgi:hypothetical protein
MRSILERIQIIEDAITKAREYLESGAHADWRGFSPLFTDKMRDGKALPPHKDWVKNVFLPRRARALRYAEKMLEKLERASAGKSISRRRHGDRAKSKRDGEPFPLPPQSNGRHELED